MGGWIDVWTDEGLSCVFGTSAAGWFVARGSRGGRSPFECGFECLRSSMLSSQSLQLLVSVQRSAAKRKTLVTEAQNDLVGPKVNLKVNTSRVRLVSTLFRPG